MVYFKPSSEAFEDLILRKIICPTIDRQTSELARRMNWRSASNIQCKIDGGVGRFLYVPLRILGCLQRGLWGPKCCKGFQTVAETDLTTQIVADGFKPLQSVAKQFADSCT